MEPQPSRLTARLSTSTRTALVVREATICKWQRVGDCVTEVERLLGSRRGTTRWIPLGGDTGFDCNRRGWASPDRINPNPGVGLTQMRVDTGIHTGRMTYTEAADLFSEIVDFLPGKCSNTSLPQSDAKKASCSSAAA